MIVQLCRLLETGTSQTQSYVGTRELGPESTGTPLDSGSNDYMEQRRCSFVSYGVFLEAYWSHFPQRWTRSLGTIRRGLRRGLETQQIQ